MSDLNMPPPEPPKPLVTNPIGVSGLTLAFLLALLNLCALQFDLDGATVAAINVVLGAAVGLVSEIVRRK